MHLNQMNDITPIHEERIAEAQTDYKETLNAHTMEMQTKNRVGEIRLGKKSNQMELLCGC